MISFRLPPVGRHIGGALAVIALLGGVYAYGRSDGASAVREAVTEADRERADEIREQAIKTRRANEERNRTLTDDDLERRLLDIRGRKSAN
jgi:hypothetical protein